MLHQVVGSEVLFGVTVVVSGFVSVNDDDLFVGGIKHPVQKRWQQTVTVFGKSLHALVWVGNVNDVAEQAAPEESQEPDVWELACIALMNLAPYSLTRAQ